MTAPIRTVRVSDDDWAEIRRRAEEAGEDVSTYLRRRALEPDSATRRDLAAAQREDRARRERAAAQLERVVAELREE